MLADEDERFKIFRYEDQKKPDLWVELKYNKVTGYWTGVRTAWSTPEGSWQRLGSEPIKNHAVAKSRAFLFLLERTFEFTGAT